ncbi:hypothetical protein ACO03V_10010 [Microbacterium sp. HMH0099]|uniref:hypothetical protein n=1 Tax=Microbacterium sp. HMH0099 TaxID=3414026 RepID=UPI003BF62C5B
MTIAPKITVSLASLALLAGMTACAPTAESAPVAEATPTAQSFTPAPSFTPTPAASPEVPNDRELADKIAAIPDADGAPRYCDTGYTPPAGALPYDQGPRAKATGEVAVVDGVPKSYTVASNDNIVAIGGRFCLDYSTIPGMSNLDREIWPGDVLTLLP